MKNNYFLDMMRAQEKWRLEDSINLLPSENMSSPQVRALLSSDFGHRYTLPINAEYAGEYMENSYRGTKLTTEVELKAEKTSLVPMTLTASTPTPAASPAALP